MECQECGTKEKAEEKHIWAKTDDNKIVYLCQFCIDHYCSFCNVCGTYVYNGLCTRLENAHYDKLEASHEKLVAGLYKIRKSTEIMEARRFAEQALEEQKNDNN